MTTLRRNGRKMKNRILAFAALLLLSLLHACEKPQQKLETEFIDLFDTVSQVVGYAADYKEFSTFTKQLHEALLEYHKLYDIYNSYEDVNNLKTINDNAGKSPVKVDKRIVELIIFSKKMHSQTNGLVNIALGPVLKIWHDFRTLAAENPNEAAIPEIELLKQANEYTNIEDVLVDEAASTVFLRYEGMSLDVGAIAKGYALERVCEAFEQAGYKSILINLGGNVRAMGAGQNDKPFRVGIKNPLGGKFLNIIAVRDCSLVSSGGYERYYMFNGRRYHHIIDPNTLCPSDYFEAVSVLCRDSALADALSTAIFIMDYESGLALINSLEGVEALWVMHSGEVKYSDGFKAFIVS